jgi:hypothetical protein
MPYISPNARSASVAPNPGLSRSERRSGEGHGNGDISLDIRRHFGYESPISLRKGRRPGDAGRRSECGARGRRLVTFALGRLGHQPAGTMTGVRGASLQPGPAPAGGTPPLIGAASREAWPDAEPWGCVSPFGESRGGTPEGVLPPPVPSAHPTLPRMRGRVGRRREGKGGGSAAPPPYPLPQAAEDKVGVRRLEIRVCRRSASFLFCLSWHFFLGISFLAFLSWLAEHDRAESRSHRRLRRDAIMPRRTILRMALA